MSVFLRPSFRTVFESEMIFSKYFFSHEMTFSCAAITVSKYEKIIQTSFSIIYKQHPTKALLKNVLRQAFNGNTLK